jgi:hypothetical protein
VLLGALLYLRSIGAARPSLALGRPLGLLRLLWSGGLAVETRLGLVAMNQNARTRDHHFLVADDTVFVQLAP